MAIKKYVNTLKKQNKVITDFDKDLWMCVIDKVVIYPDRKIIFHFKDGSEVPWKI